PSSAPRGNSACVARSRRPPGPAARARFSRPWPSELRDLAGGSGELQDMHASIRAVDNIDIAAVVDLEVVGLDRDLAALGAVWHFHAALVGLAGLRGDVIADLLRLIRVADVDRAHPRVEPGYEHQAFRVHRRLVLVRRMRAEAAAAGAEIAARLGHVEIRHVERQ